MSDELPGRKEPDVQKLMTDRLAELIHTQFRRSVMLILVAFASFFGLFAFLVHATESPPEPQVIEALESSHAALVDLTERLVTSASPRGEAHATALLAAVSEQSKAHQLAAQRLEMTQAELSPTGLSFLQLLGGSVILALLGYLGLQRLQNLDAELQNLREFMFAQVRERVAESQAVLMASIGQEVSGRYEATKDEMDAATKQFLGTTNDATNRLNAAAGEVTEHIEAVEARVTQLLQNYEWLNDKDVRQAADEVDSLQSVEQAHAAASKFNRANDSNSARLALNRISDKDLMGDADDFHNAHTEAMRMQDPLLALKIVERGLDLYPGQYDLMADKAHVLMATGRVDEAVDMLEAWRRDKPHEFARGWRPVVFYANAVQEGDLTEERIQQVEAAFTDVTKRLPYVTKPWSSFARFYRAIGRTDRAIEILEQGLTHVPFSQEINYVLGQILLEQGQAEAAVERIEMALRCDFQEQYQHDIMQDAVLATAAQAYEAAGDSERAELLYRQILKSSDPRRIHVEAYASNRLRAIATLRGEEYESPGPSAGDLSQLLTMFQQSASAEADEES